MHNGRASGINRRLHINIQNQKSHIRILFDNFFAGKSTQGFSQTGLTHLVNHMININRQSNCNYMDRVE